ncbi:MAG: hypothetical protein ACYC97_09725 [Metallibacterium sp.]
MTVEELKKQLNTFDEKLEVFVATDDLRADSIKCVESGKPCKEDDEEGEELTREMVVWIEI